MSGEPGGPILEDRADPVQRLHVVLERGTAEQPDLCDVRRTQTRLPALTLDRIDHRGLFAADVRARSAAEVEPRNRTWRIALKIGQRPLEDFTAAVILVAQVDVHAFDADGPCRDDRAFEKPVWIALEIVPILERTRLAFVDVDRHQTRSRFGRHDLPFPPGGEACAAEATQARFLHERDDVGRPPRAADARLGQAVSARGPVGGVVDVPRRDRGIRHSMSDGTGSNPRGHRLDRGVWDRVLTDDGDWRGLAATEARRRQHPDPRA